MNRVFLGVVIVAILVTACSPTDRQALTGPEIQAGLDSLNATVEERYSAAFAAEKEGKLEDAIYLYQRLLERDDLTEDQRIRTLHRLLQVHSALDQWLPAAEALANMIELDSDVAQLKILADINDEEDDDRRRAVWVRYSQYVTPNLPSDVQPIVIDWLDQIAVGVVNLEPIPLTPEGS